MVKGFVFYAALLLACCSLAAQSCTPTKTYAFKRLQLPGTISIQEQQEDKPPKQNFMYEVYIETSCNKPPQVQAAWINGSTHTAEATLVEGRKVKVGVRESSGDSVHVQAAAGRYLYQLSFTPAETALPVPASYKAKANNKILLHLKWGTKDSWLLTPLIQVLRPLEMY